MLPALFYQWNRKFDSNGTEDRMTIVITGATGGLNGATVEELLKLRPASEIAIVSRDPAKAQPLANRWGVAVREGDYDRPESLPRAFADADQLVLVSSNDPSADAVSLHRAAIDAAGEAGVGRILYTSHQGAAKETPFGPGRDHRATEEALERSGVPWTSLRNGFYMHSIGWLAGPWRETGTMRVPADGPVSWTAREDAARAASRIIDTDGTYNGPVTITAPEAPTFDDLARVASEVSGRTVTCEVLGDEAWVAEQIQAGRPERMAQFTLGMYHAARDGFFAGTDPLLETLLDGPARSVRDELEHPTEH
jgi:uncharacterized protein YbjT (DUF2867 family)